MEKKKYNITVGNETKEFEEGTTYQAVAKEFCGSFSHPAVLAVEGENRLQELRKTVEKDCELKFITTADAIGHETYKRSLCFLLVKAVHDVAGHDKIERVRIHFSVDKGYYCTVDGDIKITEQFLADVAKRMRWLSDEKIPIKKKTIHTDDAIELFHRHGMYDKEKLFEYRRVSKVNIYSINEFEDYYYGYMVPDTGYLKYFSLHLYDEGFVIQMPVKEQPEKIPEFRPSPKLFHVLKESVLWGDCQDIETVGALNDGLKPHPIAVDNYFVDREHTPKDSDGNYDFECLEAIDIPKFNEDMRALLKGEEVYLPIFDFKSGKRKYESKPKKLGSQDILVIEGIHCLNPKLTETMADANKFKIYISALTQLNIDEHNRIPTTDGRLIRRIVRDSRTRGASASKTISMWASVRRGEEKNIFPFQEEADVMFNSSLIYELAVLKQYVEPLLFAVDKDSKEFIEAKRLLKFFDYFVGIGSEFIPTNSLLREFVGGGCFRL